MSNLDEAKMIFWVGIIIGNCSSGLSLALGLILMIIGGLGWIIFRND